MVNRRKELTRHHKVQIERADLIYVPSKRDINSFVATFTISKSSSKASWCSQNIKVVTQQGPVDQSPKAFIIFKNIKRFVEVLNFEWHC